MRGLVRAAQGLGVRVHGGSPVAALARQGTHWIATTAQGHRVQAQQVVLGTNGYTYGLWPGLGQTVLAANSFIVATRPLGAAGAGILPGGETGSTSQRRAAAVLPQGCAGPAFGQVDRAGMGARVTLWLG